MTGSKKAIHLIKPYDMPNPLRIAVLAILFLINSFVLFAQPIINSFTPLAAAPGNTITINGNNFSASAASNTVFFGAVKAVVTAASPTQLSVTVPNGAIYQSISVTVNGLTAYSSKSFLPTFAGNSDPFNAGSFATSVDSSTGTSPYAVALADFDGDGKTDMCSANYTSGNVSVLRSTTVSGALSFNYKIDFPAGTQLSTIAAGDVDGDGKPDIVVNNGLSSISILLNTSTGSGIISFAPASSYLAGTGVSSIAIGDIDGDGKTDIVAGVSFLPGFTVFRNTGSPGSLSFAGNVNFLANTASNTVCISDIDGDNKPDIILTNQGAGNFSSFRNISTAGTISFAARIDIATGSGPGAMKTGDLDGDGKTDVVIANHNDGTISIFRNTSSVGSISYAPKVDSVAGETFSLESLTIGDLNGDARPDIAVVTWNTSKLTVYNNLCTPGNIILGNKVLYNVAVHPKDIAIGDIDGDGKPDLTIVANSANKLSVLRKTSPLSITGVSPLVAPVGAAVTITGFNFKNQLAENIVFFGGVKATVTAASYSLLTVTVPPGATYSPVSVTVDHHTVYSPGAFSPSFTGGDPIIANSFAAKTNTPASGGIYKSSAIIADFDGDGKIDFAGAGAYDSIRVYRNTSTTGNVSFANPFKIYAFTNPLYAASADINGDGKPEIVVPYTGGVQVFPNNCTPGNIAFGSSGYYPLLSFNSSHVFVQDFDNDARLDILVEQGPALSILPNTGANGSISFAAYKQFPLFQYDDKVAVGDMDGDGKVDIIAGNYYMRNTSTAGNISFDALTSYTSSTLQASFIASADIDGDGKPDLIKGYNDSTKVYYYLNNSTTGNISFTAQGTNITGTAPTSVAFTDLNGDGKPDIAVTCSEYNAVSVFANASTAGNISFIPKVDYCTNKLPGATVIGDFDGDERPDMLSTSDNDFYSVHRYEIETTTPTIPAITSISPTSGSIGTTVIISGNNFTPAVTGNIVQFGTAKATVTAASANSLTVTVPAGATYQPIRITNASGLSAFSQQQFNTTFPGAEPVLSSQSFDIARKFLTGDNPAAVAIGDLNGDGKNDIAVVNKDANTVSVLMNTSIAGSLSFAVKVDLPVVNVPSGIAIGDIDGDSKPDLIITSGDFPLFSVLKNTSSGSTISFDAPVTISSAAFGGAQAAYICDIDLDGRADLVLLTGPTVSIFRNTSSIGNISLATPITCEMAFNAINLIIKDFDGNGKPDIGYTNYQEVYVFSNTSNVGDISFTAVSKHTIFPTTNAHGIACADFNNDGDFDIASILGFTGKIGVAENKSIRGTHLFDTGNIFGVTPSYAFSIASDDLDGDGKADIIIPGSVSFSPAVCVFKNASDINTIQFLDSVSFAIPHALDENPSTLITADMDGDGRPDIITSHFLIDSISILRNKVGDPISFCADGNGSFTTNITATSYQWQLNSDSTTFNNITNNSNYSGTNTATLQLSNIPSSFTGNQYRCVTNNGTSQVFAIRFYNEWTGAINNQWENAGNWSCGTVPDIYTDVIIHAPATVVLNSNTSIATLLLDQGVNFTVITGHTLTLAGH